jgi:hypothetical protein
VNDDEQSGPEPSRSPESTPSRGARLYFALPDGYWTWTEEEQRQWAREVVKALREKLKSE